MAVEWPVQPRAAVDLAMREPLEVVATYLSLERVEGDFPAVLERQVERQLLVKPTFNVRPAGIPERQNQSRLRLVSFWKLRIVKRTRKPPKF